MDLCHLKHTVLAEHLQAKKNGIARRQRSRRDGWLCSIHRTRNICFSYDSRYSTAHHFPVAWHVRGSKRCCARIHSGQDERCLQIALASRNGMPNNWDQATSKPSSETLECHPSARVLWEGNWKKSYCKKIVKGGGAVRGGRREVPRWECLIVHRQAHPFPINLRRRPKKAAQKATLTPTRLIVRVYLRCTRLESTTDKTPQNKFQREILSYEEDLRSCP